MNAEQIKYCKIIANLAVACLSLLIAWALPPMAQDPAYHRFADQRGWLGIPHFWNVASNLPFTIVGLLGVYSITCKQSLTFPASLRTAYLCFFAAVALIGVGSAYYHLQPDNDRLAWDRLPMAIAFMAFLTIIIGEYLSEQAANSLLLPLLAVGSFSVYYWHVTEQAGAGDLRLYGLVQFLPLVLIPLIMILFPARYTHSYLLWLMLGAYGLAKLLEIEDAAVYRFLGGISGHSLKHVAAALGPFLLLLALWYRKQY